MNWKSLFLIAVFLVGITRIPAAPERLSFESTNLAFALEQLDPRQQQPHAPGFPFFVFEARILAFLIPGADLTFLVISILVSAGCLVFVFKLAAEMYGLWEARAAAMLLLVNPIFWFSGLQSPLWPHLAFFSALAAWFSWRAWDGDGRSVFYGALTLGVSFGFLPEAVVYLLPLWVVSAWKCTRSRRAIARGLAVVLLGAVLSLYTLWVGVGSAGEIANLLRQYPFAGEMPSLDLPLTQPRVWIRSLGRFFFWNLIASGIWLWVFFWRRESRVFPLRKHLSFAALWVLPAAALHVAGGLSGPGHMVAYIPALCVIGGRLLSGIGENIPEQTGAPSRELALAVSLLLSVLLFGEFVTLPDAANSQNAGGVRRVMNIASYSVWETSIGRLRWSSELADTSLWEVGQLTASGRPTVMVGLDNPQEGSQTVSWRVASYYERNHDIWTLVDSPAEFGARKSRGRVVLEVHKQAPIVIRVPKGARIIWLIDRNSEFMKEARNQVPVNLSNKYVTYTDMSQDQDEFRIGAFLFSPS